jgi:hypothetical protein
MRILSRAMIGPVSIPRSIFMSVRPVSSSPLRMAHGTGAAPLCLGSREACRLTQPRGGRSRIALGRILPYAVTKKKAAPLAPSLERSAGSFRLAGWITSMPIP